MQRNRTVSKGEYENKELFLRLHYCPRFLTPSNCDIMNVRWLNVHRKTGRNITEVMVGSFHCIISVGTQFQFILLLMIFISVPWLKWYLLSVFTMKLLFFLLLIREYFVGDTLKLCNYIKLPTFFIYICFSVWDLRFLFDSMGNNLLLSLLILKLKLPVFHQCPFDLLLCSLDMSSSFFEHFFDFWHKMF